MTDSSSTPAGRADLPLGVITVDTALVVRTWSAWIESATGIPADEAIGRPLGDVVPSLASRGLLAHFERAAATGEAHVLAPAFHKYLIPCPPSSPSRHFDRMQQMVTLGALMEGDRIVGVMATIEDVTARLDAERALVENLRSDDAIIRRRAEEALAAVSQLHEPGVLVDVLGSGDWQTRRAAVSGLSRHASRELLTSLITALRDQHRDFNVLGSALQLLSRLDLEVAGPLADLLQDPDHDLRIQAALALGDHPGPVAGAALVAALKDPDANVRFHAIEALGRIGWSDAVEPLAAIAASGDFFLAFPAVDALSRIADPRVAPLLISLVDDEMLALPVAGALGRLAGGEAVRPLTVALARPGAPATAMASAIATLYQRFERRYAGGDYIAAEFVAALTPAAGHHLVSSVGTAQPDELPALVQVLGWVPGEDAEGALVGLLERQEVRAAALDALVARGGASVVDALIAQLDHEDEDVQLAAIDGLGRLGDRRAAAALAQMLGRGRALTVAAAGALASIGAPDVLDALFDLLREPDAAVRHAAIGALNSLGHPETPHRVASLLRGDDPRGRESAVRIAGYFGYPEYVDEVLARCDDPEEAVRRAAVEQFPHLKAEAALDRLVRSLTADQPRVRAAAAGALADVEGAGPALTAALRDPDLWVRYFAARSLGAQRYEPAFEALEAAASSDPVAHVRIAAAEAIGAIGGPKAASALADRARDADPAIAAAAARGLGMLRDPAALPPLVELLHSADVSCRRAAMDALAARGDREAVAALRWTAGIEGEEGAAAATAALGRVAASLAEGAELAVDALVELCADPSVADAAAAALARVPEAYVDRVAQGLSHPHESVRRTTIEALTRRKSPRASAFVRQALDHEDAAVREAAVMALDRVGSRGLLETFKRMAAEDPSPEVRRAASTAVRSAGH